MPLKIAFRPSARRHGPIPLSLNHHDHIHVNVTQAGRDREIERPGRVRSGFSRKGNHEPRSHYLSSHRTEHHPPSRCTLGVNPSPLTHFNSFTIGPITRSAKRHSSTVSRSRPGAPSTSR